MQASLCVPRSLVGGWRGTKCRKGMKLWFPLTPVSVSLAFFSLSFFFLSSSCLFLVTCSILCPSQSLPCTTALSGSVCVISTLPFTFCLLLFPLRLYKGWVGLVWDGQSAKPSLPLILQQTPAWGLARSWYLSGRCCRCPLPRLLGCPNGRAGLAAPGTCLGAHAGVPLGHARGRSRGGCLSLLDPVCKWKFVFLCIFPNKELKQLRVDGVAKEAECSAPAQPLCAGRHL